MVPEGFGAVGVEDAGLGAAESRSTRPVMAHPPSFGETGRPAGWPLHSGWHGPAPGAGALQRLRDVPLLRHQAGRRGHQGRRPQAVAPQPRERGMSRALGLSACRPASDAAAPAPRWCGRRSSAPWSTPRPPRAERSRPRHRRWHRRFRGPAGRAWPPGHRGRPQPRRPGGAGAPSPGGRGRGRGRAGRPLRPARPGGRRSRRGALPRRARGGRRPGRCPGHDPRGAPPGRPPLAPGRPAARRGHRAGDGRPLRRRRSRSWPTRPTRPPAAPATGSPRTRPKPCWPAPASRSPRPTGSGSSPTWSPAPCSTSSPVPPRPWSSWSAPSPSVPSTSRWRPSCTCSPTRSVGARGTCSQPQQVSAPA